RHTRSDRDWSSDVCSSDLDVETALVPEPAMMFGDAAELREVLTNLILNAVDAMPEGGSLKLSSVIDDTEVEARIDDTGQGMTERSEEHTSELQSRSDLVCR